MSENRKERPLIGVGVLVWRQQQLLLGERFSTHSDDHGALLEQGCWQFPGGHLEAAESVSACARREVMEETGLMVKDFRHLGFTDSVFSVGRQKYITLLLSCEYESGEAQLLEPDKCRRWSWFDYRQLPQPLFEPIKIFLSQHAVSLSHDSPLLDLYALHRAAKLIKQDS